MRTYGFLLYCSLLLAGNVLSQENTPIQLGLRPFILAPLREYRPGEIRLPTHFSTGNTQHWTWLGLSGGVLKPYMATNDSAMVHFRRYRANLGAATAFSLGSGFSFTGAMVLAFLQALSEHPGGGPSREPSLEERPIFWLALGCGFLTGAIITQRKAGLHLHQAVRYYNNRAVPPPPRHSTWYVRPQIGRWGPGICIGF